MNYKIIPEKIESHRISKNIHSVFFEYFGKAIYDGIWVGRDSETENIDGIRKDVIDGCKELSIGAMRWPGGCCADHYHWKNGIGKERKARLHPIPDSANTVWRHDFGTDEFLHFCHLTGATPIITVNTATGTPEEFLDWFEYINGAPDTKYGSLRKENGHEEPYNVKYWGIGNTDENVWHIDFNNPASYAQNYLRFQTVLREDRNNLYFIGLGLSTRHKMPGWAGNALNYITANQQRKAPDALSVHHYLGGAKRGGEKCGGAIDFTDEGYYKLLDLLERYQYDIDLHRVIIKEHTGENSTTKICFDEWGVWHPEATMLNNQNQPQSLRDAIFAALTFHIFYKNCDIVEFAMETQLSNLLQSLFETDGEKFYKTPTFYIMKLLKEHMEQYLVHILPDDINPFLDTVSTISEDGESITVSIVNKHLYDSYDVKINLDDVWHIEKSEIIFADDVHAHNTFENPECICIKPFDTKDPGSFTIPAHSVIRICYKKGE